MRSCSWFYMHMKPCPLGPQPNSRTRLITSRPTRSAPAPPPVHALRGQTFFPSPEVYRFGAGTAIVVCQSPLPGLRPRPHLPGAGPGLRPHRPLHPGPRLLHFQPGGAGGAVRGRPRAPRRAQDPRAAAGPRPCASTPATGPLLVLSELQGEYAFLH